MRIGGVGVSHEGIGLPRASSDGIARQPWRHHDARPLGERPQRLGLALTGLHRAQIHRGIAGGEPVKNQLAVGAAALERLAQRLVVGHRGLFDERIEGVMGFDRAAPSRIGVEHDL